MGFARPAAARGDGDSLLVVADSILLRELTVTALQPVSMRGDTLVYDLRAFPVPEGSRLGELLRRLPLKPLTEAELDEYLSAHEGARYRANVEYFMGTDLFSRMCGSPQVYRELPFTLAMDTEELLGVPSAERVLLQGVIDVCFREGDGFVLLDYKTDRVMGDPVQWAQRHRRQVELYARALTTLTGRPVVEKYVVFLNGRACVRL